MRPSQVAPSTLVVASSLALCLAFGCREAAQKPADSGLTPGPEAAARAASPPASLEIPEIDPPITSLQVARGERVTGEGKAMGTKLAFASFTNDKLDAAAVRKAFDAAIAEIMRIEALMTTWREDAQLARANASAGKAPVEIDDETMFVVKEALKASELSKGTFDITFESLHGLWKFDQDLDPSPPSAAAVKARLPSVNYRFVKLDETKRSLFITKEGTRISLGGIAKGYAVDRAAKVLRDAGLRSFYVQAGGDLYAAGLKPDGSEWSAGVRDPRGPDGSFFALLPISDRAFSTAGDYERSYIAHGKRFHHIIDPRTGYPATACRSVTIWAKTALEADAIDDAVFILGPEKGLALVESLDDVGAVIVDAKNKLWVSKRLEGKIKVTRPPTEGL